MKFLRRLTGGGADAGPARPLPNTYWVQPGHLLAGEYPGSPDDEEMAERLHAVLREFDAIADDAAQQAGVAGPAQGYILQWSRFDNATGAATKVGDPTETVEMSSAAPVFPEDRAGDSGDPCFSGQHSAESNVVLETDRPDVRESVISSLRHKNPKAKLPQPITEKTPLPGVIIEQSFIVAFRGINAQGDSFLQCGLTAEGNELVAHANGS